jgi:3-oxoacyl-[acyl-carrier protein] reductase
MMRVMMSEIGSQRFLEGKKAIITGATSGIGKAIALLFLQQGASVTGIGTNPDKGMKLIEEVRSMGHGEAFVFERCDVSSKDDVDHLFSNYFSRFQTLDILVNNAGITRDGLLMRMSLEDWENVIDTNLTSCFLTCQHACRPMMKARSGRIINISSVVGLSGNPGQTNYAASKAGIVGFSRSLSRELSSRNILVNCIAPGYIETDMTEALGQDKKEMATQQIPLGHMGTPLDVAQTALFLASDMSAYITGQVIVVDGGLFMG